MQKSLIIFYFNGKYKEINIDPNMRAVDVIREELGSTGTKEGCSDGDCGACTIVVGKKEYKKIQYRSVNSCLLPAAKLHKSSVITIEGLKEENKLNLIQEAMVEEHGAQCGFCSPGIIMSFLGAFLGQSSISREDLSIALEGNICRCTGYQAIVNAGDYIIEKINQQFIDLLPKSIRLAEQKLKEIPCFNSEIYKVPLTIEGLKEEMKQCSSYTITSGFTDLGVRKHNLFDIGHTIIDISSLEEIKEIKEIDDGLYIGGNCEIESILQSNLINNKLPIFKTALTKMASKQIRNVATLAGNICNASPIGDGTVLLMALDAKLIIMNNVFELTEIPLRDFYLGYKKMRMTKGSIILAIVIPKENYSYNISFEKTGKRNAVDIASVNSASRMLIKNNKIINWEISIGGISESVIYRKLPNISINTNLSDIEDLAEKLANEFTPLSDVRGSSDFRTLLIQGHLIKHFFKLTDKEDTIC